MTIKHKKITGATTGTRYIIFLLFLEKISKPPPRPESFELVDPFKPSLKLSPKFGDPAPPPTASVALSAASIIPASFAWFKVSWTCLPIGKVLFNVVKTFPPVSNALLPIPVFATASTTFPPAPPV